MAPANQQNSIKQITCPCQEIGSIQSIQSALASRERTNTVVTWLSNSNAQDFQLSCQSQSNLECSHRVSASFSILNGIRDAVRPFLEAVKPPSETPTKQQATYEESFPSLSSNVTASKPNVIMPKSKSKKKVPIVSKPKKEKRRVSLQPATHNDGQGNIAALTLSSENEWPAISVGKKPEGSLNAKPKRRIKPAPATTWGTSPSGIPRGNIEAISSSDAVMAPTQQDFDNVKQNAARPMMMTTMGKKLEPKPIIPRRKPRDEQSGKQHSRTRGNIETLPSSDAMPVPTKADFDNVKQKKSRLQPTIQETTSKPEQTAPKLVLSESLPPDQKIVTTKENRVSTQSTQPETNQSKSEEEPKNLALIYATLILNNLVPSTALELHLLVRLLTADELSPVPISEEDENARVFHSIFVSTSCCHSFAIDVLSQLKSILHNLPLEMVEGFVNCQPFASMLPDLTRKLNDVLSRRKEVPILSQVETISLVDSSHSQMPLLTLPFDEDRDSRHNYRSRDEVAIYKNREESRDAFLYQLRAFQNTRGKMVDAKQAERSIDRIRTASRNVIQGLFKSNMFWFAQFFCDLLMQIGLVPMEETDKELLNIADKDKLQKLHKRFSAKGSQTSKSSKNLVLDPSKSAGTASPVIEAQQHFPGHQEFFFIFLLSTDCYSFGVHLRNRLKSEILKLVASRRATKGAEKRISQLMLLSRFLGLLIFSPSWHESGLVGGPHYDLLSEFNPDLDVHGLIERAYNEGNLVITMPWMMELLRMARWSPTVQKSADFRRLLALLLGIRHGIELCESTTVSETVRVNMRLVSMYLESLFGDVVGLEKLATVPARTLPKPTAVTFGNDESTRPDERPLRVSMSVLFTSNPHAEELCTLLSSQTTNRMKTAGSSRKLTPYSVGGTFGSSTDPLGSSITSSSSPVKAERRDSLVTGASSFQVEGTGEPLPIVGKLVEAFFHQHRDLKEICEFIVDHTLKNAASKVRDECVVPLLNEQTQCGSDNGDDSSSFDIALVIRASRIFLSEELSNTVPAALASLCPPTIQPKVRDIASKLTISHGTRLGESTIESLVRLEAKKLSLEMARKLKKLTAAPVSKEETDLGQQAFVAVEDALVALRTALSSRMWERRPDNMKTIVANARKTLSQSKNGTATSAFELPRALDLFSVPLISWCLQYDGRDGNIRWDILANFVEIIAVFCTKSVESFFTKIASLFSNQGVVDKFIDLGLNESGEMEQAACLLLALSKVQLIPSTMLEMSLISSLRRNEDKGRVLCEHFISQMDECQDENEANQRSFERVRNELSVKSKLMH